VVNGDGGEPVVDEQLGLEDAPAGPLAIAAVEAQQHTFRARADLPKRSTSRRTGVLAGSRGSLARCAPISGALRMRAHGYHKPAGEAVSWVFARIRRR